MRKMKTFVLSQFFLLVLISCGSDKNKIQNPKMHFVEKFGKENFDVFLNYSIGFRAYDWDKDSIIIISDSSSRTTSCNNGYSVIFKKNSDSLKEFRCFYGQEYGCVIDTSKIVDLALKFRSYHIGFIKMDSAGTIIVSTIQGNANLMRFSQTAPDRVKAYGSEWIRIQDNWYER